MMRIGKYRLTLEEVIPPKPAPVYVICRRPYVGCGIQLVGRRKGMTEAECKKLDVWFERMDYDWCWRHTTNSKAKEGAGFKIGDECLNVVDGLVETYKPMSIPLKLAAAAKKILGAK